MPEGPEAHTMASFLREILNNKNIIEINILDSRHAKNFASTSLPCTVQQVCAHGKRPIIVTNRGYFMTFLCMNGRWLSNESSWTRVILKVQDPTNGREFNLYFDDQRSLGSAFVEYFPTEEGIYSYINSVGRDLLNNPGSFSDFLSLTRKRFKGSVTTLDTFLLSTKSNCTVGNYLKSEILYYARLSPNRTLSSCSDQEIENLFNFSISVSRAAYSKEGFTMKDYLKPDGSHGMFRCVVYKEKIDPEGNVIERVVRNGRTTYWVPELQH